MSLPRTRSYYVPGLAVGGARNVWVGTWAPPSSGTPGRSVFNAEICANPHVP
jgi:hypothetical protein